MLVLAGTAACVGRVGLPCLAARMARLSSAVGFPFGAFDGTGLAVVGFAAVGADGEVPSLESAALALVVSLGALAGRALGFLSAKACDEE